MYYECLPIVSDLPANKEWIEDGKNGIIVSSNDENIFNRINEIDIEKAIIFNRNLIKQMGDKGVNGNIFLNLYRSLLQKYD
jgi:hypothetical protein